MHRSIYLSLAALSLLLSTFAPVSTSAQGLPENQRRMAPPSKGMIETPLKGMINPGYLRPAPQLGAALPVSTRPDFAKPVATYPVAAVKSGVATKSGVAAKPMVIAEKVIGVDAKGNAKVRPGAVNWHKDFDAARSASLKSGKPVLMFAMIGSLDDKFC